MSTCLGPGSCWFVVDGRLQLQIRWESRYKRAIRLQGPGTILQQHTFSRWCPLGLTIEITNAQTSGTIFKTAAYAIVVSTGIEFINTLADPLFVIFLGGNSDGTTIAIIALDVNGDIFLDRLVAEECWFTFQITLNIFNKLGAFFLVTTCTYINLLDLGLGDVTLGIGCLDVIVEQLIAVLVKVGVIEVTNLLSWNLFKYRGRGRLPGNTVHHRSQVPLYHAELFPFAYARWINVRLTCVSSWIVELVGLVLGICQLVGMNTDLDLDVADTAEIIGVGVDGKAVIHIHLGPAFCLGGIGTTRVVWITLWPPYGRTGAILVQTRSNIGLGKGQRLIE